MRHIIEVFSPNVLVITTPSLRNHLEAISISRVFQNCEQKYSEDEDHERMANLSPTDSESFVRGRRAILIYETETMVERDDGTGRKVEKDDGTGSMVEKDDGTGSMVVKDDGTGSMVVKDDGTGSILEKDDGIAIEKEVMRTSTPPEIPRYSIPTTGHSIPTPRDFIESDTATISRTNVWAASTRAGSSPYNLRYHMDRIDSAKQNLPYPLVTSTAVHLYRWQDLIMRRDFQLKMAPAFVIVMCVHNETPANLLETIKSLTDKIEGTTPKLYVSVVLSGCCTTENAALKFLRLNFPPENCESLILTFEAGEDLTAESVSDVQRILNKANYTILEPSIHRKIKNLESQIKLQKRGFIRTQVKNYFSWKPDNEIPKQNLADVFRKLGDCYLWIKQYEKAANAYRSGASETKAGDPQWSYCMVAGACSVVVSHNSDLSTVSQALSNISLAINNSKMFSTIYRIILIRCCITLGFREIRNELNLSTIRNSLKYLEWATQTITDYINLDYVVSDDKAFYLRRAMNHHLHFMILRCICVLLRACLYLGKCDLRILHSKTMKYIESTFPEPETVINSTLPSWEMPANPSSGYYSRCYRQKVAALFSAGCDYLEAGYLDWADVCFEPIFLATLALGVGSGIENDGSWATNRRGYGQWNQQSVYILKTIIHKWKKPCMKDILLGIVCEDYNAKIPVDIESLDFSLPFLVSSNWVNMKDYRLECCNSAELEESLKDWTGSFARENLAISAITESPHYLVIGKRKFDAPVPNVEVLLTAYQNWIFDVNNLDKGRRTCRKGSDVVIGLVFFNPFRNLSLKSSNVKLLIGTPPRICAEAKADDVVTPVILGTDDKFILKGKEAKFVKLRMKCPDSDWILNGLRMELDDRVQIIHKFLHHPSLEESLLQNWDRSPLMKPETLWDFETGTSTIKQFDMFMNNDNKKKMFRFEVVKCRISIDFEGNSSFSVIVASCDILIRKCRGKPFSNRILTDGKDSVDFEIYTKCPDKMQVLRCLVKCQESQLVVVDIVVEVEDAMSIEIINSNPLIFKLENLLNDQGLKFQYIFKSKKSESQEVGPVQWYCGRNHGKMSSIPDENIQDICESLRLFSRKENLEDMIIWKIQTSTSESNLVYIRNVPLPITYSLD